MLVLQCVLPLARKDLRDGGAGLKCLPGPDSKEKNRRISLMNKSHKSFLGVLKMAAQILACFFKNIIEVGICKLFFFFFFFLVL